MKKILLLGLCVLFVGQLAFSQNLNFSPEASDRYQNAMNALRMRRLSVARQEFQEIIEKFPDDAHASLARRQLVAVMRDLKEYEPAMEMLNKIISTDKSPDNVRYAREELLDILFELQRFKQGIDLLEEWRRAEPDDVLIGRQLAKFYLQSGRKDEAWLLLESLVEKNAAPDAFKDLLELALRSGEIEKLLHALESRRARYRSNEYAEYVSDCYIALGRKDKAIEVIKEVSDLKNHLMLLRKLSGLQIDAGAFDEAVVTLDLILKILPDDWGTLRKMGHCRFVQNKPLEAIEIWRRPLKRPYMSPQEFYQEFTAVLIEHQLYEEALKAFKEARTLMRQTTMFCEEVATVLEAMGRKEEALEEYLNVIAAGFYKSEVFDKLYESSSKDFVFEKRLLELREDAYNTAVLQALLELYFRLADPKNIDRMIEIVASASGGLDEFFYERINQEALLISEDFHFDLTEKMMHARSNSTLSLRLAALLLEMAAFDDSRQLEAFNEAAKVAGVKETADADLKAALLIDLAEYALNRLNDAEKAHKFLDAVLQTELLRAAPERALAAAILKARVLIYGERFDVAASLLNENEKMIQKANADIFAADPVSESDYLALVFLEKARLAAHSGDYQKALTDLKNIVEKYSESEWVNDALELALFITRRSTGDFSLLQRSLKAERLKFTGKHGDAIVELEAAVSANASATPLVKEMQADMLLLRVNSGDQVKLLKEIDAFIGENPSNFKTADLYELKWRILKKSGTAAEIKEHLQTFVDTFPSDLRSGRFKKILAVMAAVSAGGK